VLFAIGSESYNPVDGLTAMTTESNELQRLDFAAKSRGDGGASSGTIRFVFTALALFIVLLAVESEAPARETFIVRVLAVIASICVLISWVQKRYAGFAWAAMFFAMAIGALLTSDYSRSASGWTARLSLVTLLAYTAFLFCKRAWGLTVTQGPSWNKEREQVEKWTAILGTSESPQVLQFSSESFWTGYFVYRMLNTGFCWVVAKFKRGNVHDIIECRVLDLSEVRQVHLRAGELEITIDNRSIPKVKASPDMQARLLNSLNLK
jgi:hypothetical protein